MSKFISALFLIFFSTIALAQGGPNDEAPRMADAMRNNGKIYVVVAVVVAILIGLFIYVITVDRKISKLEKHAKP
jgi:uncharacterized membrane protein